VNSHVSTYRDGNVITMIVTDNENQPGWDQVKVVINPGDNIYTDTSGWTKVFDAYGGNPTDQSGLCEGTAVTIFKK
jgi:hypothetical protein